VDGGDGASTFGGSSVTGGTGHPLRSSHSRHLDAHSGKMSLLQVGRLLAGQHIGDASSSNVADTAPWTLRKQ
jgi:hypothetical protein